MPGPSGPSVKWLANNSSWWPRVTITSLESCAPVLRGLETPGPLDGPVLLTVDVSTRAERAAVVETARALGFDVAEFRGDGHPIDGWRRTANLMSAVVGGVASLPLTFRGRRPRRYRLERPG